MTIGDKNTLINYTQVNKGGKAISTDHSPLFLNMILTICPIKTQKVEIYNFKDLNQLAKFKNITSNTAEFSKCFNTNGTIMEKANRWFSVLESYIGKAFTKIRL